MTRFIAAFLLLAAAGAGCASREVEITYDIGPDGIPTPVVDGVPYPLTDAERDAIGNALVEEYCSIAHGA